MRSHRTQIWKNIKGNTVFHCTPRRHQCLCWQLLDNAKGFFCKSLYIFMNGTTIGTYILYTYFWRVLSLKFTMFKIITALMSSFVGLSHDKNHPDGLTILRGSREGAGCKMVGQQAFVQQWTYVG